MGKHLYTWQQNLGTQGMINVELTFKRHELNEFLCLGKSVCC